MACSAVYVRSNRTFMELKWTKPRNKEEAEMSSNRTFMELKSDKNVEDWIDIHRSNRTFMELKCLYRLLGATAT